MARLQAESDTNHADMSSSRMTASQAALPAPNDASLHEAALAYLARYAASRAGVIRVLDRKIARWARLTPDIPAETLAECRAAARRVAARLEQAGLINDSDFAAIRARSLTRAGRSRRAVAAHLGARGVGGEALSEALPDSPENELAACLILARKRRIGPFRPPERDEDRRRELGVLARAGFAQSVAQTALDMSSEEAEERVIRLRQG